MPEEISFNFTPEEALEYFRRREEKKVSWSYKDVWEEEHKRAFMVAKMTKATLLNDVQKSLDKAMAEGKSFEQWRSEILPKLDKVWMGRTYGDLWDEMTPEEQAKHEEPTEDERKRVINESRLTTIFRTNMFSSYQAGRYRQLVEDAEDYPYWRYVTMDDAAVRPMHAALHGKVFRWDDPFWDTHYPPNGFNCRCEVEGLDDFDLEAQGLTLEEGEMFTLKEPDGTERAAYRDTDGKTYLCDKGWSYNVGKEAPLYRVIEDKDLPEQLRLQLDWDLQQYEPPKAAADEVKATAKKTKAKTAPKAAEPATVKPAAQPSVKPAAQPSAEPAEETPPGEAKPKKSRKPKADKLQEQELAILRDMKRQNKELEKLYQQLDTPLPKPSEESKLEAVKAETAPAAADAQAVKQAEKEVKPLKAADTNSKKEAKKAKKLKKKTASGSKRRADEAPKKVKKAKVKAEDQAVEIELPPVKEEGTSVYHDTPIPANGKEESKAEPLRDKLSGNIANAIKVRQISIDSNDEQIDENQKLNINLFIDNGGKFDIEAFEDVIMKSKIEHIALVNRDRELIAYNAGKHGEADLSTQLYELLANDNNYNKPIFLSEEETKSRYGKEYDRAFTDEAIKYLVIKYKLKGGQLLHNHPEKRSPLTVVDIQSCLYFQLGKVTALCIDGSKYILVDDLDIKIPEQKIDSLIKQLKFVDAIYRKLGTTWSFYDSFRFILSGYNNKFRYYRKQEGEDRTDES